MFESHQCAVSEVRRATHQHNGFIIVAFDFCCTYENL